MSFKIKKFNIESKWKEAIISKLNYVDSDSIVVPGGKTPLFLYKEYFSKKLSNIIIPSDDRLTEDITKSNYNFIKSYSKTRVIKLCEFPVSDYKDVNLNKISDSILLDSGIFKIFEIFCIHLFGLITKCSNGTVRYLVSRDLRFFNLLSASFSSSICDIAALSIEGDFT